MPNWHQTQECPRPLLAQEGQDSHWLGSSDVPGAT